MSTYNKLCDIYRRRGFRVVAGVPQAFSTATSTEFAWLFQNGFPLTHHLGISPQEIYFFESLFEHLHPRNILVIGNSFGWSSLALAILNPNARILTIEIGDEEFTKSWVQKSNQIADAEGLRSRTALGRSPEDTQELVRKHLGPVDFCFIDGAHSPEQIGADFEAVRANSRATTVFVFHDIVGFGMWDAFFRLGETAGLTAKLLLSTTSGLGLLLPTKTLTALGPCLEDFGATPEAATLLDYFRAHQYDTIEEAINGPRNWMSELRENE